MSGSSSGSGFRDESLGLWDRMAAGWQRDGDSIWAASRAVGEWMVAAVCPEAGDTVLELAAGPGRYRLRGGELDRRLGAVDLYGLRA
jgi:hypothetical protein